MWYGELLASGISLSVEMYWRSRLIEPDKPWQNGVAERFDGKFRDEHLSLEWFRTRAEAKVVIESWR